MSKCGECKLGCFMEGVLYCEESLGEEQCVARLQEALYELSDRLREEYNRGYCDAVQGIADEMVKQGKYIAQDRPQAEWRDLDGNFVPLDENGCPNASVWCSNCGEWLTASDEYWITGRFCPNCGMKMKGAKNERI